MTRLQIFILILLTGCVALIDCQHWDVKLSPGSPGGGRASLPRSAPAPVGTNIVYSGNNNNYSPTPSTTHKLQSQPSVSAVPAGVGAWGYMTIILTVVLSGIGLYYFIILYPVVCKKERMYDVMEMTAV